MSEKYTLSTPLWRWSGGNGGDWFFVTIDDAPGEALSGTALMQRLETGHRSGWGSVKVEVSVGQSRWRTSAFPSKDRGWIVPIKASVRKSEGLYEHGEVRLALRF